MRPQLPKSLKQLRIRNIAFRCVSCFLLLSLFIFIIIMWGNKIFPSTLDHHMGYAGLRILFYVIILLIPFLITGVPLKLIDKSWGGTITAIKVKENLGTTANPRYVHVYQKEDLILTIKKDDGKEIEHTVLSLTEGNKSETNGTPKGKIFYHTHKYNVGDRAYKYYGFKYLYFVPKSYQDCRNCIRCGSQNNMQDATCWYCDAELINGFIAEQK